MQQCYLALDADEEPAVDVVQKLGADYFVVSTDYPHADGAFPEAMKEFLALSLDDAARRKILWDNCARLYNIPKLAAPLTRAAPAAAAAQIDGRRHPATAARQGIGGFLIAGSSPASDGPQRAQYRRRVHATNHVDNPCRTWPSTL